MGVGFGEYGLGSTDAASVWFGVISSIKSLASMNVQGSGLHRVQGFHELVCNTVMPKANEGGVLSAYGLPTVGRGPPMTFDVKQF